MKPDVLVDGTSDLAMGGKCHCPDFTDEGLAGALASRKVLM